MLLLCAETDRAAGMKRTNNTEEPCVTVLVFSIHPSILSTCLYLSLPIVISIPLSVYPYPSVYLPTYKSIHSYTLLRKMVICVIAQLYNILPKIVYSSKDKTLDGKPAFGIVSWSL